MENKIAGIKEDALDNLILKVNGYAEKVKKILIDFDDVVLGNIEYFDCDIKDKFLAIHNENKYNYSIFEKNILSYADDLMNVKKNWHKGVENAVTIFDNRSN